MVDVSLLKVFSDITALVSIGLIILSLLALTIFESTNISRVSHDLFVEIAGVSPLVCSLLVACFGWAFVLLVIAIALLLKCITDFLDRIIAYILIAIVVLVALITLASAGAFFGFINPSRCITLESSLVFSLVENNTSPAFQRWKLDARCVSDVECALSAHTYILDHCNNGFIGNLVLVCLICAFIFIAVLATIIGMILDPDPEHESTANA